MTAVMKRGDRLPALTLTITDAGAPVDLTAATAIRLIVRAAADRSTDPPLIDATIPARPADGVLSYPWADGDTATAGEYRVEVEVTWPGGLRQTFPGDTYGALRILPDLG